MNTGKQINAMVVVLFLTLIAVGAYAVWDPFRAESSEDEQIELTVERGAVTFTQNCRLCHGDAGQGGVEGGRLAAAAALDRDSLRGINLGAFDEAFFDQQFKHISDTIMCGRVGTQMPTWGETEGGTLNEEQIRQLSVLIAGGDPELNVYHEEGFWDIVQEHADEIDAETTLHSELRMPEGTLGISETEIVVSDAGPFSLGQYIRFRLGEEEGEERMRILPHALRVERGADGTVAASHDIGAAVLDESGAPVLDALGENEQALIEALDREMTLVVVGDPNVFEAGDVIQVDDELIEVTEIVRGLPTTGLRVVREFGREPDTFLISDDAGLEAPMMVRVDSELFTITEVRPDGDTGIVLATAATSGDGQIAVDDPAFFGRDYVLRLDDELVRVIGAVETGQELAETIGRANTFVAISGTEGIEPEMVLRADSELMRVREVLGLAGITVVRDGDVASHDAGTEIFAEIAPPEEGGDPTYEATGVALLEDAGGDDTAFVLTGIGRLSPGMYRVDDEVFEITDVTPAEIRVERGVDGTEVTPHGRRILLHDGNLLEVERGFDGTGAAAHDEGTDVLMTEVKVDREQDGSELADHAKNAEIYLGNSLIVERGVKASEPAEHENGSLVLDFPTAPDGPPSTPSRCGQNPVEGGGDAEPPAPFPDTTEIEVALSEFEIDVSVASVAAGAYTFTLANTGGLPHNLRVIETDLAPDALPVENDAVVESELNVVVSSANVSPQAFGNVLGDLTAGSYVLICNVPTHYDGGMRLAFEVTP